jgi:hypothetical protein
MTRAVEHIIRPDRRVAARLETLAYLFDVSPETIRRAVEAGKLKPSKALGPPLYRVDDVEKLLFGGDTPQPSPSAFHEEDPSIVGAREAFGGAKKKGARRAPSA